MKNQRKSRKWFYIVLTLALLICLGSAYYPKLRYQRLIDNFQELSIKEVKRKIAEGRTLVIYFGRETCTYCVDILPELDQLMSEYQYPFFYVDTSHENDELSGFMEEQGIEFVPTILMIDQGEVLDALNPGVAEDFAAIQRFIAGKMETIK